MADPLDKFCDEFEAGGRQPEPKHALTVELYTSELDKLRNLAEFTGLPTAEMAAALLANAVSRKTVEFEMDRKTVEDVHAAVL